MYKKSRYQRHLVPHLKIKAHKCDTWGNFLHEKGAFPLTLKLFTLNSLNTTVMFVIKHLVHEHLPGTHYMLNLSMIKFDVLIVLNMLKHLLQGTSSQLI